MFKNYVKIFLRNFRKNKVYSFLNILGLSVSLALVFLIVLYVRFETTYDAYNLKADRIYRVIMHQKDLDWKTPCTSYPLAPILRDEYPEVEYATRKGVVGGTIDYNDIKNRAYLMCVDPEIFDIFSLEFIYGSPEDALKKAYDIILSEEQAEKYFPDENPVEKTFPITIYPKNEIIYFTIKGVIKDVPNNSTLRFPFIVNIDIAKLSIQAIFARYGGTYEDNWDRNFYETYILLKDGVKPDVFTEKMNEIPARYHPESDASYFLQPMRDIYFHSNDFVNNSTAAGNLSKVYLFSAIALLILFIACTNFIILATAQSLQRAKEIAVRKVVGADRKSIVKQVQFESLITALFSCLVAIGLTYLFRAPVEKFLQTRLEINYMKDYVYPLSLILITLIVGLASGMYISLHISRLNPLLIIKSRRAASSSKSVFRKIIMCLQMVIFIGLISSSITIYKQLHFFRNYDMGFDKEQVIKIEITSNDFNQHYDAFLEELQKNPNIIDITGGGMLPPYDGKAIIPRSLFDDPEQQIQVESYSVDFNFFETYDIELKDGRTFSREFACDTLNSVILNETAVNKLHIPDPVGKKIDDLNIVGVVKDFNFHSLQYGIEPMMFQIGKPISMNYVGIKVSPHDVPETIAYIKDTWKQFNKGEDAPFRYSFTDELVDMHYRETQNFARTIIYCTIFAIFVACLGLFGLTMFTTQQKYKEIGIRKIFGASPFDIVTKLSKEIVLLSVLSTIIAAPIVIYLLDKWLMGFAYQTNISFWIFPAAGIIGLIISLLTMSFFSIKASLTNPVETVKYE